MGYRFHRMDKYRRGEAVIPGALPTPCAIRIGILRSANAQTREAQAALAREHGVEAFCYYHYWFAGKRLLARPFDEVLASGSPNFPFCLCWANQTWTGIWHGAPDRILIQQTYPDYQDHRNHFFWLLRAFSDPRYLTVQGKPLFCIYRPMEIPEIRRVTDFWRELALKTSPV